LQVSFIIQLAIHYTKKNRATNNNLFYSIYNSSLIALYVNLK